ncbi:FAD-dependent pyridine nucleotide-disulfide oxidoreductase [Paenibacillus curdlanolyticus YK9]|uniref:FAD-dependent pyridine nucleotide-disulfide oxidoreductase n=1 Tax=Paenibacillus curdlanolyticus YK9 TaxID=717606 RepID=E0I585_9BACL|nr:YpdA family putative bacillithiol disulfide reductase [Paenibacillus curdlanolyticus]EFM12127.1 FAD-dependent pyridine nucleotide-disulfide oxidoreductase [Paenibacillus curdlanolyticus YK9]
MQTIHPINEKAIIIGAGPCGLAAALELQQLGLSPLIIESRNIVHSISQYPTYMRFFSTPELLEIGGIPFTTSGDKPTRQEALAYYRTVTLRRDIRVNAFETVTEVRPAGARFSVTSVTRFGEMKQYACDTVIIATGYFDHPNTLGIPGEETEKVSHFFRESHPYTRTKVAIIGGSNSAIDAALELERVGAEVTVVYRGEAYYKGIKPWVLPLFEGMVNKEKIHMRFRSRVTRIDPASILIEGPEGAETIPNDFVLALTGFHPDRDFLTKIGVAMEADGSPQFNDATMETNVPGVYLAGVVASRREANEVFIETGRHHGRLIAEHLSATRLR